MYDFLAICSGCRKAHSLKGSRVIGSGYWEKSANAGLRDEDDAVLLNLLK